MFSIFSQDALSRGQLLRLCFSRAVVKVCQAVKADQELGKQRDEEHGQTKDFYYI
jgi:hypothetical protein